MTFFCHNHMKHFQPNVAMAEVKEYFSQNEASRWNNIKHNTKD